MYSGDLAREINVTWGRRQTGSSGLPRFTQHEKHLFPKQALQFKLLRGIHGVLNRDDIILLLLDIIISIEFYQAQSNLVFKCKKLYIISIVDLFPRTSSHPQITKVTCHM